MAHAQSPQTSSLTTTQPFEDEDEDDLPLAVRKNIAVLGARGVGKTAVAIQCAMTRFEAEYMPTFSATYKWKPVINNIRYDISIIDTDGQDANSFFGLQYSIGIDGYVLMYSVRDEASFEIVKAVHDKLLDTLNVFATKGTSELPRILVGNQIDVTGERRVPYAVAKAYADEQGIPYFETSAFTAHNVNEAFTEVLLIIQANLRKSHSTPPRLAQSEKKDHESTQPNKLCSLQ